jgi:cytochrome c oxidase subunit II
MVTFVWLTPTRTGTFEVLCAELCGVGHAFMRGTVIVVEEEEYAAWLGEQPSFAELRAAHGLAAADPPQGPVPGLPDDEPTTSDGSTAALLDEDAADERSAF